MHDEYASLANRFRVGGHLDAVDLRRLRELADWHDNYLLCQRVAARLARA